MLSARMAEKVALKFYKERYPDEKDISITQLSKTETNWKKYDISLDGTKFIDVKNARAPISCKKRYVEHCVPRFKLDRQGKDVLIAGVLSSRLRLNQLLGKEPIDYDYDKCYFLGETSRTIITDLEERFNSNEFEICGIRTFGNQKLNVIPPWVFNYPDWFYHNQSQVKTNLRTLEQDEYPPENHWQAKKRNPIPALVYCKCSIPEEWHCVNKTQGHLSESCMKKATVK